MGGPLGIGAGGDADRSADRVDHRIARVENRMRGASQAGGRQMSTTSRRIVGAIIVLVIVAFLIAAFSGLVNIFPPGA
jgi:hypothetical protein